jgi:hypothetical protein
VTLEELADTLPNGLHDAFVKTVLLDFTARTAVLDVSLWVGDIESGSEDERERRRSATITLHGLQFFVIDPPDPGYAYASPEPLWFVDISAPVADARLPRNLPREAFASSFFVNQSNSFVHVAALDVTIAWTEDGGA